MKVWHGLLILAAVIAIFPTRASRLVAVAILVGVIWPFAWW